MSNVKTGVRTFSELSAALQARAGSIKSAAQKKAAENDPTPEKDPTEKGQVAVPKDPDANPAKQNTPDSKTNVDGVTSTLPAPAPGRTVDGPEKVAAGDLSAKAAKVAAGIKGLADKLMKKSEVTQPGMPPNDVVNTGSDGGANKPPSGGAGSKNNPDPAVKDASPGSMPADKTEKGKAPMPKSDDKGELPPDQKNNDKSASEDELPVDPTFHLKLASIILSTEEGREFAQAQVEKFHGVQAAQDIVKAAALMEAKAEELARLEESGALAAEEMWKSASAEEQEGILRLATVLSAGREGYATEHEKLAYDAGAAAAAELADQGMLDQDTAPDGVGLDEAIVAALDEMIQKGEITPEEAEQVLAAVEEAVNNDAGGEAGAEGGEAGAGLEDQSAANREAAAQLFANA